MVWGIFFQSVFGYFCVFSTLNSSNKHHMKYYKHLQHLFECLLLSGIKAQEEPASVCIICTPED